ncbi:uncharacterized protein RJT20DRAFT_137644 [Scheffersomyces xylosifermentans]|uniref:uncharacterized protein n=1 Tax=Scheffersomyces xylosifermentans TaxID=1304137 RepID=UPI00315CA93A
MFHLTSTTLWQLVRVHPNVKFKRLKVEYDLFVAIHKQSHSPKRVFSNAEIVELDFREGTSDFDKYGYNLKVVNTDLSLIKKHCTFPEGIEELELYGGDLTCLSGFDKYKNLEIRSLRTLDIRQIDQPSPLSLETNIMSKAFQIPSKLEELTMWGYSGSASLILPSLTVLDIQIEEIVNPYKQTKSVVLDENCSLPPLLKKLHIKASNAVLTPGWQLPKGLEVLRLEGIQSSFLFSELKLPGSLRDIDITRCNIHMTGAIFPKHLGSLHFLPLWIDGSESERELFFNTDTIERERERYDSAEIKLKATNLLSLEWVSWQKKNGFY